MTGSRVLPAPLEPGARIAVVAPGSRVRREPLRRGMRVLESWGYEVVPGPHLLDRAGDLAGDDPARAADLRWALSDPGIDAAWIARGGWGTARLLADVAPVVSGVRPRRVLGFSDATALFALLLREGWTPAYAPLVADLADSRRYVARDLRGFLRDPGAERRFAPGSREVLVPGRAEGMLAGGCLAVLAALAGTPWQPDLEGAVLFLEEVGEAPYRVDRMLWQLRESGMLRGVRGLLFGQFVGCRPLPGRPSRALRTVLREHAEALGVPALAGLPVGHGPRMRVLPLGYVARLDAEAGEVTVSPPA